MSIKKTILLLVKEYNKPTQQINQGECEEFAEEILRRVPNFWNCTSVCNENFQNADGSWNVPLLQRYWPHVQSQGMDDIFFGGHVWLTAGVYHYDAECPEGVINFFDLPFFQRYIKERHHVQRA